MWLEDQENILLKAKQDAELQGLIKGEIKGQLKGQLKLLLNLLEMRLGQIPADIREKIEQLSLEQLEELARLIFQINSWDDVESFWNKE